jgi:hypothetical protein
MADIYPLSLINKVDMTLSWKIELNDIEILAGMLAASVGISSDMSENSYSLISDTDVSKFLVFENITEENIKSHTCNDMDEGQFAVWMKSDKRFYYNLYKFQRSAFFQGIISLCQSFQVDFRNYLYGFPFDKDGRQYVLNGYLMTPYQVAQDAPDLNDVEEEEHDDENIIEPLKKDY